MKARDRATKPLGRKAYGSIPHLGTSRLGPGEHKITDGQARILTERARDRHDHIVVTEKLDGANVAVANVDGRIVALGRAGYPADSAPFEHIQLFAEWVRRSDAVSRDCGCAGWIELLPHHGMMCHGEWLAMAHGTRYLIAPGKHPFYVFDITRDRKRLPWAQVMQICAEYDLQAVPTLSSGPPVSVQDAIALTPHADGPALHPGDGPEGVVWRVERRGHFDFMAKWVRPDKIDGKYFDHPVWNWRPGKG